MPCATPPDRRRLSERQILELVAAAGDAAVRVVVTVIGGQGHIFGRGNQQLSAEVIGRVGLAHVLVVASETKLLSLHGGPLLVDSGDSALDARFTGYLQVVTGSAAGRSTGGRRLTRLEARQRVADHRRHHGQGPVDVEGRVERRLQADAVFDGHQHRTDRGQLAARSGRAEPGRDGAARSRGHLR